MNTTELATVISAYVKGLPTREQAEVRRVIDIGVPLCDLIFHGERLEVTYFEITDKITQVVCEARYELLQGWPFDDNYDKVRKAPPYIMRGCICGECLDRTE